MIILSTESRLISCRGNILLVYKKELDLHIVVNFKYQLYIKIIVNYYQ